MGSNVTDRSIKLAAESIDVVHHVCNVFLAESSEQKLDSDRHSYPSFEKDFAYLECTTGARSIYFQDIKTSQQF